jgi:hypothetical protein
VLRARREDLVAPGLVDDPAGGVRARRHEEDERGAGAAQRAGEVVRSRAGVVAAHRDDDRSRAGEQLHGAGVGRRLDDDAVAAPHERRREELDRALRAGRDDDLAVGGRRALRRQAVGDRGPQAGEPERRVAADRRAGGDRVVRAARQRDGVLVEPRGAEGEVDEAVVVLHGAAEQRGAQCPGAAGRDARGESRAAALPALDHAPLGQLGVRRDDGAAADARELRERALGRQARAVLELLPVDGLLDRVGEGQVPRATPLLPACHQVQQMLRGQRLAH